MKPLLLTLVTICLSCALHAQQVTLAINPQGDPIYTTPVQVMPQYKAGEESLYFRLEHIRYLFEDRMQNIQGKILVQFVVEKDGTLSNIKMVHGLTEEQDKEVLRVIGNLRKWKPGLQDGKPVRVLLSLPIDFKMIKV